MYVKCAFATILCTTLLFDLAFSESASQSQYDIVAISNTTATNGVPAASTVQTALTSGSLAMIVAHAIAGSNGWKMLDHSQFFALLSSLVVHIPEEIVTISSGFEWALLQYPPPWTATGYKHRPSVDDIFQGVQDSGLVRRRLLTISELAAGVGLSSEEYAIEYFWGNLFYSGVILAIVAMVRLLLFHSYVKIRMGLEWCLRSAVQCCVCCLSRTIFRQVTAANTEYQYVIPDFLHFPCMELIILKFLYFGLCFSAARVLPYASVTTVNAILATLVLLLVGVGSIVFLVGHVAPGIYSQVDYVPTRKRYFVFRFFPAACRARGQGCWCTTFHWFCDSDALPMPRDVDRWYVYFNWLIAIGITREMGPVPNAESSTSQQESITRPMLSADIHGKNLKAPPVVAMWDSAVTSNTNTTTSLKDTIAKLEERTIALASSGTASDATTGTKSNEIHGVVRWRTSEGGRELLLVNFFDEAGVWSEREEAAVAAHGVARDEEFMKKYGTVFRSMRKYRRLPVFRTNAFVFWFEVYDWVKKGTASMVVGLLAAKGAEWGVGQVASLLTIWALHAAYCAVLRPYTTRLENMVETWTLFEETVMLGAALSVGAGWASSSQAGVFMLYLTLLSFAVLFVQSAWENRIILETLLQILFGFIDYLLSMCAYKHPRVDILAQEERDWCRPLGSLYVPSLARTYEVVPHSARNFRGRYAHNRSALRNGYTLALASRSLLVCSFDATHMSWSDVWPLVQARLLKAPATRGGRPVVSPLVVKDESWASCKEPGQNVVSVPKALRRATLAEYLQLVSAVKPPSSSEDIESGSGGGGGGGGGPSSNWRGLPFMVAFVLVPSELPPEVNMSPARIAYALDRCCSLGKNSSPNFLRVYDYSLEERITSSTKSRVSKLAVISEPSDIDLETYIRRIVIRDPQRRVELLRGIISQVVLALHATHTCLLQDAHSGQLLPLAFVHRDLRPKNIRLVLTAALFAELSRSDAERKELAGPSRPPHTSQPPSIPNAPSSITVTSPSSSTSRSWRRPKKPSDGSVSLTDANIRRALSPASTTAGSSVAPSVISASTVSSRAPLLQGRALSSSSATLPPRSVSAPRSLPSVLSSTALTSSKKKKSSVRRAFSRALSFSSSHDNASLPPSAPSLAGPLSDSASAIISPRPSFRRTLSRTLSRKSRSAASASLSDGAESSVVAESNVSRSTAGRSSTFRRLLSRTSSSKTPPQVQLPIETCDITDDAASVSTMSQRRALSDSRSPTITTPSTAPTSSSILSSSAASTSSSFSTPHKPRPPMTSSSVTDAAGPYPGAHTHLLSSRYLVYAPAFDAVAPSDKQLQQESLVWSSTKHCIVLDLHRVPLVKISNFSASACRVPTADGVLPNQVVRGPLCVGSEGGGGGGDSGHPLQFEVDSATHDIRTFAYDLLQLLSACEDTFGPMTADVFDLLNDLRTAPSVSQAPPPPTQLQARNSDGAAGIGAGSFGSYTDDASKFKALESRSRDPAWRSLTGPARRLLGTRFFDSVRFPWPLLPYGSEDDQDHSSNAHPHHTHTHTHRSQPQPLHERQTFATLGNALFFVEHPYDRLLQGEHPVPTRDSGEGRRNLFEPVLVPGVATLIHRPPVTSIV